MKRRLVALAAAGVVGLTASCQDFLDVNTNPNAPETVAANLYLSPMLHWVATSPLWDGRATAEYAQMLSGDDVSTYDTHGPNYNTDFGGQVWRDVYWSLGQNLIDMMEIAEAEERWDILGVGYTLKAWGWYALTSLHGEIIISEAFDQTKFNFGYDSQEFAYEEIQRNLDSAIVYLSRTDGAVDATYMAVGDKMYNGDRTKWLKFAHGLYAITLSHYSNKASYDPAAIIQHVDASLASANDDALWGFGNTEGEDRNFLGRARGNYTNYRTTQFAVGLMSGTALGPAVSDPRMSRMIGSNQQGGFVGVDVLVNNSWSGLPDNVEPYSPHGYFKTGGLNLPQLYIFSDLAKVPVMTYAQLQFVKAEAAFRAGNKALARTAYIAGINGHFDFVNNRNRESGLATQISTAERNAFLANTAVVPTDPNALTLTRIMTQKYIAQWGWAFIEGWMDLRRYHYTDLDPATGQPVYPGYQVPPTFHSFNEGKPVYRLRPRYNSEYVWNQAGLEEIGGNALDYHTKPLWIITP